MSSLTPKHTKKSSRNISPRRSPASSGRKKHVGDHERNLSVINRGHVRKNSIPNITGFKGALLEDAGPDETTFEELDQQITQSTTFQDLWRIVRMVSAQSTFEEMTKCLEKQCKPFVKASSVRFFFLQEDYLIHNRQSFPTTSGIIGYVYQNREIVCLKNPSEDPRYSLHIDQDPLIGHSSSMLCLPVVADSSPDCKGAKDVFGIICAVKGSEEKDTSFSKRDCTALYRIGEFAGNTLRNARKLDLANSKYSESLQVQNRGKVLLEIAKALSSEHRLEVLVSDIVSKVPELLDCDRCTLFFVDKEKQELIVSKGASHGRTRTFLSWIFGQSNAPELPFQPGQKQIRFKMERGIAGHVALTGECLNIEDAHEDNRFNPEIDKKTGYRTKSILCMPMVDSKDDVIGVLQTINKNPAHNTFDKQDETLLKTFAAQAAIAVKNSKLFEQTNSALKRSDALLEITNALSKQLQLAPLIKTIVRKVQSHINSDRCTVFIVDSEKKELYTSDTFSAGMGAALPIDKERDDMIRFPMSRGIAGNVATTGKIINIPDAYKDERFNQQMDKETGYRTRSILCTPIKNYKDEIIGVTQVINKEGMDPSSGKKIVIPFTEEDEIMLNAFNAQASIAIENSRLFSQTERALNHALAVQRNLRFHLSVTKNLFSEMHLGSMIEQMTIQVHHLLKADNCALYLVDNKTKQFYLAKDENDPTHKRFPFSVGIVGTVASTGRVIRVSKDAFKDPRFHPAVDQRKGCTTHSILCCPITAETHDSTQVIGVISVRDEKDRGGFERQEENLLKIFCNQAAIAIVKAQKFVDMLDQSELKENSDDSAALYLMENRGMKLGSVDIDKVLYTMDEVKLISSIGTGSYGEVYKANVRGKVVAVKKLHVKNMKTEQLDSFCKEASLMCQLNHPNIVQFIGAVTEPSNLCIITEYCVRGSMADLLLEGQVPMDFLRKLKFARDAAAGMVYLHNSNPVILHRDLKSDNLLVTADWVVKVADFGLTRFMSEKKAMTQVGTPMWMAPEIIMGKKYTEKADVYAFGIILWEILTRLEPYEDKEPMQIVVEVVNDDLRPIIPQEFANSPLISLMKDCWDPKPSERPNFKVVLERLDDLISEELALKEHKAKKNQFKAKEIRRIYLMFL